MSREGRGGEGGGRGEEGEYQEEEETEVEGRDWRDKEVRRHEDLVVGGLLCFSHFPLCPHSRDQEDDAH